MVFFLFSFKAAGAILGTLPLCPHPILITLQRSHFHMSLTYKSGDYIPSAWASSEHMQTVSVIFQSCLPWLHVCVCPSSDSWEPVLPLVGTIPPCLPCVLVGWGVPSQKALEPPDFICFTCKGWFLVPRAGFCCVSERRLMVYPSDAAEMHSSSVLLQSWKKPSSCRRN